MAASLTLNLKQLHPMATITYLTQVLHRNQDEMNPLGMQHMTYVDPLGQWLQHLTLNLKQQVTFHGLCHPEDQNIDIRSFDIQW